MKKDTKRRVSLKEVLKGNFIYTSKTMKKLSYMLLHALLQSRACSPEPKVILKPLETSREDWGRRNMTRSAIRKYWGVKHFSKGPKFQEMAVHPISETSREDRS